MDLILCLIFFVIRDSLKAGIFNPGKVAYLTLINLILCCCRFVPVMWRKERHRVIQKFEQMKTWSFNEWGIKFYWLSRKFFSYMMRLKEVYNEFSKRFNFKLIGEISMKLMQKKMENYLWRSSVRYQKVSNEL